MESKQPKRWGGGGQPGRGPVFTYTPPPAAVQYTPTPTAEQLGEDGTRYVVVLGKRLKKNGMPEVCLSERLAFAIKLFTTSYEPGTTFVSSPLFHLIYLINMAGHFMLMSGSMVEKKANITEAECMKRIAVEAGVDPALVILEEVSWNTFSNAFCTKKQLLRRIVNRA
jgi:uncharacterized SAM-binding protein YcdF (DUF218 family)